MSDNKLAGKNYQGTFAGGQGPILGQTVTSDSDNKGIFGGEGKIETTDSAPGSTTSKMNSTGSDGLFSLQGKDYAGPENWQPTDTGTSNNFDIKGK